MDVTVRELIMSHQFSSIGQLSFFFARIEGLGVHFNQFSIPQLRSHAAYSSVCKSLSPTTPSAFVTVSDQTHSIGDLVKPIVLATEGHPPTTTFDFGRPRPQTQPQATCQVLQALRIRLAIGVWERQYKTQLVTTMAHHYEFVQPAVSTHSPAVDPCIEEQSFVQ